MPHRIVTVPMGQGLWWVCDLEASLGWTLIAQLVTTIFGLWGLTLF